MYFKSLLYFIFAFSLLGIVGCGVKGPPIAPPGTSITPWVESYMKAPPPLPKKVPSSKKEKSKKE